MKPLPRILLGIAGILLTAVSALLLLVVGGWLLGVLLPLDGPLGLAWVPVGMALAVVAVSLAALWLGVRLARWGLAGPPVRGGAA